MHSDESVVVSKQSAVSGCVAATRLGSLSKEEKHVFCKSLPKQFCQMVSVCMKVCPQHVAWLNFDPGTGKRPRPCRDGDDCKKLHCREKPSLRERFACEQKYNMPFVSVYRMSAIPGDCRVV